MFYSEKSFRPLRGVDKYMLLAPAPDKLTMTSKGRPALAGRTRRGQREVCGKLQKFGEKRGEEEGE